MKRFLFSLLIFGGVYHQNMRAEGDSIRNVSLRDVCVKVNFLHGSIIDSKTAFIPHGKSNFAELSLLWQTTGARKWQQLYHYPQFGLTFMYGRFGNDTLLGRTIAAYPTWYIETRKDKFWGTAFRMGLGAAITEKPYNRFTNPDNVLIGSSVTCLATVGVGLVVRPNRHVSITAGAAFLHCSNGHTYIPNGGIDNFSWLISLGYKPNTTRLYRQAYSGDNHSFRLNLRAGLGFHQMAGSFYPTGGPMYKIYSTSVSLSHRVGQRGNVRFGLYGAYYSSFYDFIKLEEYFPGHERVNSCVFGPFIGHEYLIGRFSFMTEAYINAFNPLYEELYTKDADASNFMLKRWLSGRIGFAYYLLHNPQIFTHQNVWFGVFIKTNVAQADYVDMALGYIF